MMKNVVLSKMEDYTVIARVKDDGTVHEYVVAWCYNQETNSWCQGHYFSDLSKAMLYMETSKMTTVEKRERLLNLMHEYLRTEVDDEEAYMSWINLVPDEPCDEDFDFIAHDIDLWRQCAKKFGRLVKVYETE